MTLLSEQQQYEVLMMERNKKIDDSDPKNSTNSNNPTNSVNSTNLTNSSSSNNSTNSSSTNEDISFEKE